MTTGTLTKSNPLTLGQEILQKHAYLKDARRGAEEDWKEITRLVVPRRSIFDERKGYMGRTGGDIYDGTAIGAVNLAANGTVGFLMSPMMRWFKLGFTDRRFSQLPGVRQWSEIAENIVTADFERSTLYEEALEFFKDGYAIGNAFMYYEEDEERNVTWFSTRHPKEIFIDVDRRNRVDTVHRDYWITARAAAQNFGENNLPQSVRDLLEKKPYERINIIHAVFPRTDRDVKKIDSKNKKFASVYVLAEKGEVLRESGYDELPYIVWRFAVNSDEVYGRGPGHDALVQVKRANAFARDSMRQAQLAANPMYNVPAALKGKARFKPGALHFLTNPNERVEPVAQGGSPGFVLEQEQDLRQVIETSFMVDFFLMLQRAPKGMTATEVMERQAEKAAVMGPLIGRIESDVLDQVVGAQFRQAIKAQRIPPPPPALRRVMQGMKVEYIGPLAQAQRKFHVQQGIQHAIQSFVPLMQVAPEIRELIPWDELGRELLNSNGMPAALVRDKREFAKRMKKIAEQQAQAQQQAQANELMANADKLGKRPEPESPMDGIMRQLAGAGGALPGGGA